MFRLNTKLFIALDAFDDAGLILGLKLYDVHGTKVPVGVLKTNSVKVFNFK